jgi:hypothetical protein
MQVNYYEVEGATRPLEIDVDSSKFGVYIRRNIKAIEKEIEGQEEPVTVYRYEETYLSKSEFEQYSKDLLIGEMNGENNTREFEEYKTKLNTGVQYTNGFYYKPKYINDYKRIMSDIKDAVDLMKDLGGDPSAILSQKFAIYDITGKLENMVQMSGAEVINLYFFLYAKKEQYFAEYKEAVEQDKE